MASRPPGVLATAAPDSGGRGRPPTPSGFEGASRRWFLGAAGSFGLVGIARAEGDPEVECPESEFWTPLPWGAIPPLGALVIFGHPVQGMGGAVVEPADAAFSFSGADGDLVPASVEAFPQVGSYEPIYRNFLLRPRRALLPNQVYEVMRSDPGRPPTSVNTANGRTLVTVVKRWPFPPPTSPRITGLHLVDAGRGGPCEFPRRTLTIGLAEESLLLGLPDRGSRRTYPVYRVWVARYPEPVDYGHPSPFIVTLDAGAGGVALRIDATDWSSRRDAFLPRYACTIGLREFDAAGNLGPPFELYVPAAPEVPGLPEEAWLPFGR